ncbi:MAG TPA: Crp/Fnr family transcriptional regulator [Micropepsaceae bacterium]|nr:Crp/Fnr family transcriptional regulator [Micropepsaceae bacterium]
MHEFPEIRVRPVNDVSAQPMPAENTLMRKEQERLRDIAKIIDCKPGTMLYAQGDPATYVYLVADGILRINHCDETGHRQILAFRVPGDFCGIPQDRQYFNSAEAVSKATIYRFDWDQMQQVFLGETHLQQVLLGKILHDYRQAQIRISSLGQQNTCQRLASFILDFIAIPEFFETERGFLTIPVNRFDLADYLGTRPESTARAFAKLEELGLIRRITARKIVILDKAGLRMLNRTPRHHSGRERSKPSFQPIAEPVAQHEFEPVHAK